MIAAVGVVVPARNEQDHIVACLRSLRQAIQRLPTETAAVRVRGRAEGGLADLLRSLHI